MPPSGPFNLTIRVYQPKQAMVDGRTKNNLGVEAGTYTIPPVTKVDEGCTIASGEPEPAATTSWSLQTGDVRTRQRRVSCMQARDDGGER